MALDEALLDSRARGLAPAEVTVRLYAWTPPALSLGRSQPAEGAYCERYLREQRIDLVRRPTGGAAVLHEHERTYAVCGPLRREPFPGGVLHTYRRLAAVLESALRELGVDARASEGGPTRPGAHDPSCFAATSSHEIAVGGRKLVGSAQVRRRAAFLQHGSILLRADPARLSAAMGRREPAVGFTDLASELGFEPSPESVDRALIAALEREFGIVLERGTWTRWERERATRLYSWKYCSLAWTTGGRLGARERRWGPPL